MHDELLAGEGPSMLISMSTTRSGNWFWQSVIANLEQKIVQGKGLFLEHFPTIHNDDALKFNHLLALTRTMIEAGNTMQDTEYEKQDIKGFFDALSMKWHEMLEKDDELLGLNLEGEHITSRLGLYSMLCFYQSKFEVYLREVNDDGEEESEDVEFDPFPLDG